MSAEGRSQATRSQATTAATRVARVAGKTHHDNSRQMVGQLLLLPGRLIRSDASYCSPSTDGEAASKREWASICP